MGKKSQSSNGIQMELFPSEKSERAIDWRKSIVEHSATQHKLWKGVYRQMALNLQGELSPQETKQIGDNLRNAATWLKQITESLVLAEQHEQAALMANQSNIDITQISDEELDAILDKYV
jgi:hypothetical protein